MKLVADESQTTENDPVEDARPRLGISRCLLGDNVRVNGGNCRDKWVHNVLIDHVELVGVCPEVEMGLPTPRPAMRLAITDQSRDSSDHRLVESKSGAEWTSQMSTFSEERVADLATLDLDGFILKKDSPTCGLWRVKIYDRNGSPSRSGRGLFADALLSRLPSLPVEEEGRLNDPALRESFLVRIHAYARWRRFLSEDESAARLSDFHARHKMLLLAADPAAYRRLGPLVAGQEPGLREGPERAAAYIRRFMRALSKTVTPGRHINVLQHLLGFCKTGMDSNEKRELSRLLNLYAEGMLPLAAPMALVRYLLMKHDAAPWATEQFYLEPYPTRLARVKGA